ncbi:alginate lyase family protein [Kribbella sp. CA-294648]|uniref:alginate lyase family protein n=1 Tax=Kribbella sp. CA-294648 TaxID=3239948 RepID=UPI003D92A9ED
MSQELVTRADEFLVGRPYSILDREPSDWAGDPHDYYSVGNYSWPNPETADGLPYIRIDGRRNPDAWSDRYDKRRYRQTVAAVNTLVQAHLLTGEARYADAAVERLERWFLDPATAMRPNFAHAAALPGQHDGAAIGQIEGTLLTDLLDHVDLLVRAGRFTEGLPLLQDWFAELTRWMRSSDLGRQEESMTNNHGVWWDAQVLRYLQFVGDRTAITEILDRFDIRLRHIAVGGALPKELARPDSLLYTMFCLRAFAGCCRVAAAEGRDLWNAPAEPGFGSLRDAFHFWADHATDDRRWIWPRQPADLDRTALWLADEAAAVYQTPSLEALAETLRRQDLPDPEIPSTAAMQQTPSLKE